MRVGMVAHTDAPWTGHYCRFLRAAGHEVLVLSFCPDTIDGQRTEFVGATPYNPSAGKHLFITRAARIRRKLREFGAEVVFAPYLISNGLAAALAWQGPLVVSARGADVVQQAGTMRIPPLARKILVRSLAWRSVHIHAVAGELADAMVAMGVPSSQIQCFPIGIDLSRFPARDSLGQLGDPPRLVCTRKHRPVYENHMLVEALRMLKARGQDFVCTFVGGGELLDETRAQVAAAGITDNVTLTGHVAHEEMTRHIGSADIYVSCSSADGTSSSLLEGLAGGLFPIVSRITANLPWVKHGENGLLFDVGDAAALADAIQRAIDDAPFRQAAVQGNRALVEERGDQAKNMARLIGMLEDAAGIADRSV